MNYNLELPVKNAGCIAVVAIISQRSGLVAINMRPGSYKSDEFIDFIRSVTENQREVIKNGVILLDNASIHTSKKTKAFLNQNDVKVIYNLPRRPDLNAIEMFWGAAKTHFRPLLLKHRKAGTVDMQALV